jgi:CRISPR-associated protein Cas2
MKEHLYIITYDISDTRRWRKVFRIMNGFGEWLQLSVFQCRLNRKRHAQLVTLLDDLLNHNEDHILIMDLGVASSVTPQIVSLGKQYKTVAREPIIV